jgi:hypothetical protein
MGPTLCVEDRSPQAMHAGGTEWDRGRASLVSILMSQTCGRSASASHPGISRKARLPPGRRAIVSRWNVRLVSNAPGTKNGKR